MKANYYIYILILLLFCCMDMMAESNDSIPAVYETETPVPVRPDVKTIESFKSDESFDYYKFKPKDKNIIERFKDWLAKVMEKILDRDVSAKQVDITYWIILGVIILAFIILLFIFRPSLFYKNKKVKLGYHVEEEDIQGINFDKLIKEALNEGNYSDAIRWKYLYTLKLMQDKELVSWNVNKTVNEYVRELKRKDLKPNFKAFSQLFLYVRYGNFETERQHFDTAEAFSNELIKKI